MPETPSLRQEPEDSDEWQLAEIQAGIDELDRGEWVSHERVSKWMRSWGREDEAKRRDEN
jgi:predicted transcriptional regulator